MELTRDAARQLLRRDNGEPLPPRPPFRGGATLKSAGGTGPPPAAA